MRITVLKCLENACFREYNKTLVQLFLEMSFWLGLGFPLVPMKMVKDENLQL